MTPNLAVIDRETGEITPAAAGAVGAWWTDRAKIELVQDTICQGATDDEFALFLAVSQRTGLDPFARQIFGVKRWDSKAKREVMQTQVSVDGLRLIAVRSGAYGGQTPEEWCGFDGVWVGAWLRSEPPAAARVGVYRIGSPNPTYAVATYAEYVQTNRSGEPSPMWRRMPARMLLKCAESLALRKAFPAELSGLYSAEEMGQSAALEADAVAPAPVRSVATVAAEIGVDVSTLAAWWTRDRETHELTADDEQKIARLHPANLPKLADAIAAWRGDELAAEAAATLDATDEPEHVADVEIVDPIDAEIAADAAPLPETTLLDDDDLPF